MANCLQNLSSLQRNINILRNVTLHFPEGYELLVGITTENVHIYYELAKVSLVANAHSIKLIVSVSLKSTNTLIYME